MSENTQKKELIRKIEEEVQPLIAGLERVMYMRYAGSVSQCEFTPVTAKGRHAGGTELRVNFRTEDEYRHGDLGLVCTTLDNLARKAGIG